MSCNSNSNKIARIVCQLNSGISQLASQKSFYAGLAAGTAGATIGVALLSISRRNKQAAARTAWPVAYGNSVTSSSVAPLGSVANPLPFPTARPANTPLGSVSNPLPFPTARPSHAPLGSSVTPLPFPTAGRRLSSTPLDSRTASLPGADDPSGSRASGIVTGARLAPTSLRESAQPTSTRYTQPDETRLVQEETKVRLDDGRTFATKGGYRILLPDGMDTGLSITPKIDENDGLVAENQDAWVLTHTRSGNMIGGPYETIDEAHKLAAKLSLLPWTAADMPVADILEAQKIIEQHEQDRKKGTTGKKRRRN